jgi:hypothetical protein
MRSESLQECSVDLACMARTPMWRQAFACKPTRSLSILPYRVTDTPDIFKVRGPALDLKV